MELFTYCSNSFSKYLNETELQPCKFESFNYVSSFSLLSKLQTFKCLSHRSLKAEQILR
jgi:hypothetical protein